MAPIQTKQMPDLSDDLRRDLESMYTPDIEAAFQDQDKNGSLEVSTSYDTPRGIVTSETALGEPVSKNELISSHEAHAAVAEVVRRQSEAIAPIKAISSRLGAFRERYAAK